MMLVLKQYAVRVKGTNCYLPKSQRRDGRGGSWLEPVDFSLPAGQRLDKNKDRYEGEMMIRTYATRAAAENLLRSFCTGKYVSDGEWGGILKKDTARDRNLFEVIELELRLPYVTV